MLVGAPTPDVSKAIGPSGFTQQLLRAAIANQDLESFQSALKTAVDDIRVLTSSGFFMPEKKIDHILFGQTGATPSRKKKSDEAQEPKTFALHMIDFNSGRQTSKSGKLNEFSTGVDWMLEIATRALKNRVRVGRGQYLERSDQEVTQILSGIRAYAEQQKAAFQ
jgi:hypothetical protein